MKELISESSERKDSVKIIAFYNQNLQSGQSISHGIVSDGKSENGHVVPFFGINFQYFDADSYLASRAFTNEKILHIILDSYKELEHQSPERFFYLMELSNKDGGKIYPHRTHQNGLSADFMIPKLKDGQPYYGLDTLGKNHYFLDFNENGQYVQDTTISVDFDLIAKHLLILHEKAVSNGYKISKVIIKLEYKEKLFATPNGKLLLKRGIYFAKNLTSLINNIHDDHYHVDFEKF